VTRCKRGPACRRVTRQQEQEPTAARKSTGNISATTADSANRGIVAFVTNTDDFHDGSDYPTRRGGRTSFGEGLGWPQAEPLAISCFFSERPRARMVDHGQKCKVGQ